MRWKTCVVAAVAILCTGCGGSAGTGTPTPESSPEASGSPQDGEAFLKALAADAYAILGGFGLESASGQFVPALLIDGTVIVGSDRIPLSQPDATFRVYKVGNQTCIEVSATTAGEMVVSSYTGLPGGGGAAAPGESCIETHTNAIEVEVPTENYPGLIGWEEILPVTGTCLDLSYLVFTEEDMFEVPFVVDCAGPHEYVMIAVPDLDIGEAPSNDEIDIASDTLCFEGVSLWVNATGSDLITYWYWSPWGFAYQEGEHSVQCVAQVAEDIEVYVTYEEAYGE